LAPGQGFASKARRAAVNERPAGLPLGFPDLPGANRYFFSVSICAGDNIFFTAFPSFHAALPTLILSEAAASLLDELAAHVKE